MGCHSDDFLDFSDVIFPKQLGEMTGVSVANPRKININLFEDCPNLAKITVLSPTMVFADDTNYQRIVQLNIELYTSNKDFELEESLEQILKDNNLTYYKEENYIDSEKLYQIAYEMEVMINGK